MLCVCCVFFQPEEEDPDRGQPCMRCGDQCPGFRVHGWRYGPSDSFTGSVFTFVLLRFGSEDMKSFLADFYCFIFSFLFLLFDWPTVRCRVPLTAKTNSTVSDLLIHNEQKSTRIRSVHKMRFTSRHNKHDIIINIQSGSASLTPGSGLVLVPHVVFC